MNKMMLRSQPQRDVKFKSAKGKVYIIEERCKGCNFCIEFCPKAVLEDSEKYNSKGYHPPEVANPDACTNCQLCELICPEFAIYVLDAKEVEAKKAKRNSSKKGMKQNSGNNKTETKGALSRSKKEAGS